MPRRTGTTWSVKFFSKLNYFIFGYFDPTNIFFDNKNNCFWGDPSVISAKTASLRVVRRPQSLIPINACVTVVLGEYNSADVPDRSPHKI